MSLAFDHATEPETYRRPRHFGLALALILTFTATIAQAALVSEDSPFGPDTVTYDTDTGLYWLDVTESNYYTYDETIAQLGPGGRLRVIGWLLSMRSRRSGKTPELIPVARCADFFMCRALRS